MAEISEVNQKTSLVAKKEEAIRKEEARKWMQNYIASLQAQKEARAAIYDPQLKAGRSSGDYFPTRPPGTQRIISQVGATPASDDADLRSRLFPGLSAIPSWLYDNPLANMKMASAPDLSYMGINNLSGAQSVTAAVPENFAQTTEVGPPVKPAVLQGAGQNGQPSSTTTVTTGDTEVVTETEGAASPTDGTSPVVNAGQGIMSPFARQAATGRQAGEQVTQPAGIVTVNAAPEKGLYDIALANLSTQPNPSAGGVGRLAATTQTSTGNPGKLAKILALFSDPSFQRLAGTGLIAAFGGPAKGRQAQTFNTYMDRAAAFDLQEKKLEEQKRQSELNKIHRDRTYKLQQDQADQQTDKLKLEIIGQRDRTFDGIMDKAAQGGWTPQVLSNTLQARGFNAERVQQGIDTHNLKLTSGKYTEIRNPQTGEITGYQPNSEYLAEVAAQATIDAAELDKNKNLRLGTERQLTGFIKTRLEEISAAGKKPTAKDFSYNQLIPPDSLAEDGQTLLRDIFTPGDFHTFWLGVSEKFSDRIDLKTRTALLNEGQMVQNRLNKLNLRIAQDERDAKANKINNPMENFSEQMKTRVYDSTDIIQGIGRIHTSLEKLWQDPTTKAKALAEGITTKAEFLSKLVGYEGALQDKVTKLQGTGSSMLRYAFNLADFESFRAATSDLKNAAIARMAGTAVSDQEMMRALESLADITDRPETFLFKLNLLERKAIQDIEAVAIIEGADKKKLKEYMFSRFDMPPVRIMNLLRSSASPRGIVVDPDAGSQVQGYSQDNPGGTRVAPIVVQKQGEEELDEFIRIHGADPKDYNRPSKATQ